MHDVLIVGGGHGGAQTAIALRQRGFAGSIAIVGEEPVPPYERPPLSKAYLAGEKPFERILIRPTQFWAERSINLLLGRRVMAVDPAARSVRVEVGETFRYGKLVWSAGGHARRLACDGHDLSGVHTVRCRADVDRLAAELSTATRVAVVGAGYIGLEAAAALRKLGKAVVVLEEQDRVLARVTGTHLAAFLAGEHRAHGVDVRTGVVVDGLVGKGGSVAGVRLVDGEVIAADLVIAGIGIIPAVAPLLKAGAEGGNDVLVDPLCRTSLPDIHAIGDCALHHNTFAATRPIRLESVQNANDMAAVVADHLTGTSRPYTAVPWFWSEQYDLKLQTVGLHQDHDRELVRGDPASRRFSVLYLRGGRVVALDCVNAARDYVQGRSLILSGAIVDPSLLENASRALAETASAASG